MRATVETSSCKRSSKTVDAPPGSRAVGDAEVVAVPVGVWEDVSVPEAELDDEAVALLLGVSEAVPDPEDDEEAVAVCDDDAVPVSDADGV